MANVAKLASVATLDSTGFSRGLSKMRVDLGTFGSLALGAFGNVGASIAQMVSRGLTALPRLTLAGLDLGDSLSDAAKMTGIAGSKLAVYHRAAMLAGMGTEEFNNAVHKLNVNVADALKGDEKFAAILTKAGISIEKIAGSSPDETFLALADAVSKTADAFERAHVVQQAFGRSGFRLLPLLSGGRGGISRLTASTQALGAAPSDRQIAAFERANDAVQDLGTIFKGLKFQLAQEFGPALGQAATNLTNWLATNKVIPSIASGASSLLSATTAMGGNPVAGALALLGDRAAAGGPGANIGPFDPGATLSARTRRDMAMRQAAAERRARSTGRKGSTSGRDLFGPSPNLAGSADVFGPPSSADRGPWGTINDGAKEDTQTLILREMETLRRITEQRVKEGMGP